MMNALTMDMMPVYFPSSHWPTLTPIILRSYLVFRVCFNLVPLSQPALKQCFTPRRLVNCCVSTHSGENQLALGSSGISPLTFSRSYRAFLSNSLERVVSCPKVFSTYLPISVSGTGNLLLEVVRAFPSTSLGLSCSSYGVETMGSVHGFSFLLPHFAQGVEER